MGLSTARDSLLTSQPDDVHERFFRYLPLREGGRSRLLVRAALHAYWLLGRRRRLRPFGERHFPAHDLLEPQRFHDSLVYQEAALLDSDSRLTLSWLFEYTRDDALALNHCALTSARWDRGSRLWRVELADSRGEQAVHVRARTLINAGGVWADHINGLCGLGSDYRHVFSKGVYLVVRRPEQLTDALVFEMGQHGDTQTFTPWGPVALWGPTETAVDGIEEGLQPTVEDVRFLLDQANRNLRRKYEPRDIIALRCGIRPLAVRRQASATGYPLSLSRRHVVQRARDAAALTIYGGKITSAPLVARQAADILQRDLIPDVVVRASTEAVPRKASAPLTVAIPGIPGHLPDPAWCARHERCATLDDYLRRRTNISQWLPRLGLGEHGENAPQLLGIAAAIAAADPQGDDRGGEAEVQRLRDRAYQQQRLLEAV